MANGIFYSSLFKELTKAVQIRFDALSENHKKLFNNVIFENYLDWDTPTVGLEFEELVGNYGITIAAPTIGDNSKEPVIGTRGLETLRDKILNHAITKAMTIQEYRKIVQLQDSKYTSESEKQKKLLDLMFGNVKTVVDSVLAKIDYIFLNALSNEGVCTLDQNSNPEGGVRGTINYNQPSGNIESAPAKWIEANKATVDCFADIQKVIDKAQNTVVFDKILISPQMFSYLCSTTLIKKLMWGTDKSSKPVFLSDMNEFMQSNGLPKFEILRRTINIQSASGVTPVTPFNGNNLVFVPSGKLGVVKNAYANSELKEEPGVTYSNYGRIRVSQWGVGETQASNGVEFVKAESYSLPVITEMNGIYTLKANY